MIVRFLFFLASMVIYLCTQHRYFTTDATLIMFDSNSRDEYTHRPTSGTGSGIISCFIFRDSKVQIPVVVNVNGLVVLERTPRKACYYFTVWFTKENAVRRSSSTIP